MNFPKANSFPTSVMRERSMGPNPLKLCEELLAYGDIPASSVVLDLGSGAGLTSALLARMPARVLDARAAGLHARHGLVADEHCPDRRCGHPRHARDGCTREAWADWIACDNEYAAGDRAAIEAGALDHLNTIAVRLRRR